MRMILSTIMLVACFSITAGADVHHDQMVDDHGLQAHVRHIQPPPDEYSPEFSRGHCDADWQELGPFGGDVADVAVSPIDADIVLAGISGGALFRSTDGGASWLEVTALSGNSVYDIEYTSTGTVYIGTADGVWKSTTGGASWTQLNLNIGLNDVTIDVAIDPIDDDTIYAGIDDAMGAQDKNVLRSVNGGSTWTDITPNMSPLACCGVAVNPGDTDNIMAVFSGGFGGGAVWVTSNGGASWTNRSAGLPANPMNDALHDGARFLICGGMAFGSQDVGVYATDDNGVSWTPLHDGSWPSLIINDVEVDPADVDVIYAAARGGIFKSIDGGVSWNFGVGGTQALMVNSIRLDPGSSDYLFLGASSTAVWRSTNGGDLFTQSSNGIGQLSLFSVAANPLDSNELAIAFQGQNDGGVYTSIDGGMLWTLESNLPPTRYNTVKFAPDGVLYAISEGPTTIAPEGLYRRNGDGAWTCLGPDQGTYFESELGCVRFSINDPDLIMLGGNDFGVAGWAGTVWRSIDAGANWTKTYASAEDYDSITDIEIIEDGTDDVMSASFLNTGGGTGGAMRSLDHGVTWTETSTGLAADAQGYALSASTADPMTIYYAHGYYASGGLYVSADGGKNWSLAGLSGTPVLDLIVDPRNEDTIYIMQSSAPQVMISTDAGAAFDAFDIGLDGAGWSRGLAFNAGYYPQLLMATSNGTYATELCRCPRPGCAGDFNGDCLVTLSDLAHLLSNYGQPGGPQEGDIAPPYDGIVDLSDLAHLLSEYGNDCN